jgi:hypothetical protein
LSREYAYYSSDSKSSIYASRKRHGAGTEIASISQVKRDAEFPDGLNSLSVSRSDTRFDPAASSRLRRPRQQVVGANRGSNPRRPIYDACYFNYLTFLHALAQR